MPAPVILLMTVFSSIFLVLPLGTWLLFAGRHDDKTRLWFAGILLLSLAMQLIIARPYLPVYMSHQIPWIMTLASWLMMIEVFRRERQCRSLQLFWVSWLLVAWSGYQAWIYYEGMTDGLGLASNASMVVVACCVLGWNLIRLNQLRHSKSLWLMILSVGLYVFPNAVRVVAFIQTGNEDVMNIFKFSWQANLLSISYVFAMMSLCFGYWGFTLDKSIRERNTAREAREKAEGETEAMRQLVEQRDQLLVMNSRFSVVSALSSFSAMLIHDIAQPLQTMQLGLESMRDSLNKGRPRDQIEADLAHLESASDRAADLVSALRTLMQSGEKQMSAVLIQPMIRDVERILAGDALQNQVTIHFEDLLQVNTTVMADRVMLQRVVMNLVANSLNQFATTSVASPEIKISLRPSVRNDQDGVCVEVLDNGGGFPLEVLDRFGQPWSSHQPHGLGMALMLSKQLLAIWSGQLLLSNRSDGTSGALVRIWLQRAD